jgi:futalosine hydrolase
MTCLLAAATPFEIAPFLEWYREENTARAGTLELDVLITGIGLTAATYHLQKQIAIKRPQLVIQGGIGGCFNTSIKLGEVTMITKDTIADQGVVEKKTLLTLFDLGLMKPNQFPYKNGWLVNPHKDLLRKSRLKKVSAISVNQVSTSKKTILRYTDRFNPTVESMEGAALHYTCLMENIPFLQLRSISNYAGERNKKKWKMKEAIANLNHELIQLITSI